MKKKRGRFTHISKKSINSPKFGLAGVTFAFLANSVGYGTGFFCQKSSFFAFLGLKRLALKSRF
jgi:hypothetical protein